MSTTADVRADQAAAEIWSAWTSGERLAQLSDECRPRDLAEGRAAQDALEAIVGERFGWKIAATSQAGQQHIGVGGPLHGRLFSRFVHHDGDRLSAAGMHMAVAEAEFAFGLRRDLVGPGPYTRAEVLDAVGAMHLAIELPDSRFEHFEGAGGPQLLADDACAARFVLGPEISDWSEVDLAQQTVAVHVNGVEVSRGSGSNVLGDPRDALTWLANDLPQHGLRLSAGDVVTTGVTTVPVPVSAGDRVVATFPQLGTVSVDLMD
jgi:2-keto-4-pentenoate hydratase